MNTDTDTDNDNDNENENESSGERVTSKESSERECEEDAKEEGEGARRSVGGGRSGSSCSERGSGRRTRSHSGSSGDSAALVRFSRKVRRMGDETAATRSQYSCADYEDEVDADADVDVDADERRLPQTSSRSGSPDPPHLLGHRGARFDDAKSWATVADSRSVQVVGLVQGQQRECGLSCHDEFEAGAGEEKVSAFCCTVVTSPNQPGSLQSCLITNFEM